MYMQPLFYAFFALMLFENLHNFLICAISFSV